MVTPIVPGSFPQQNDPVQNKSKKVLRSISEAKRLIAEHRITGAKATRIANMIASAEQNASKGKVTDAERLAREALSLSQNTANQEDSGLPSSSSPNNSEKSGKNNPLPASSATDESGSTNSNLSGERETTSYQDVSDDSGISFQSPQPLTQGQAPFAVRSHEQAHVRRETSDAILNGQRVMATITIFSRIDPRTGERHTDGGNTRVIVFPEIEPINQAKSNGNRLDIEA